MEKFTLYVGTFCPYCRRVEKFIEDNDIKSIEIIDVDKNSEAKEKLIEIGGKKQVPCLIIDGKALYESLDIINYLKENAER